MVRILEVVDFNIVAAYTNNANIDMFFITFQLKQFLFYRNFYSVLVILILIAVKLLLYCVLLLLREKMFERMNSMFSL